MSSMKVLIADDNRELCALLRDHLMQEPELEVVAIAYNGNEALEAISRTNPDVVLLDIIMPHLDGVGVLERLGHLNLSKKPAVIMLTAFGQESITKRVLDLGADYYILKPFDLQVLTQRVKQLGERDGQNLLPPVPPPAPAKTQANLELDVTRLIHELGIPAHIRGYKFLRDAIILAINRTGSLNSVTKNIYPVVAAKYDTTPSRVERAIRHSIDIAWERGNYESIYKIFGHTIDQERGRPTNSEFIAMLADRIRMMHLAN